MNPQMSWVSRSVAILLLSAGALLLAAGLTVYGINDYCVAHAKPVVGSVVRIKFKWDDKKKADVPYPYYRYSAGGREWTSSMTAPFGTSTPLDDDRLRGVIRTLKPGDSIQAWYVEGFPYVGFTLRAYSPDFVALTTLGTLPILAGMALLHGARHSECPPNRIEFAGRLGWNLSLGTQPERELARLRAVSVSLLSIGGLTAILLALHWPYRDISVIRPAALLWIIFSLVVALPLRSRSKALRLYREPRVFVDVSQLSTDGTLYCEVHAQADVPIKSMRIAVEHLGRDGRLILLGDSELVFRQSSAPPSGTMSVQLTLNWRGHTRRKRVERCVKMHALNVKLSAERAPDATFEFSIPANLVPEHIGCLTTEQEAHQALKNILRNYPVSG